MQKYLTVIYAFAIFVLLIIWAITPAYAHCDSVKHSGNHPHCEGNGGGNVATYNVYIGTTTDGNCTATGDVSDNDCPAFFSQSEGNNPSIWTGTVDRPDLDLSFFIDYFNGIGLNYGTSCFGGPGPNLATGVISQENGTAEVGLWFRGFGNDGMMKDVKYLLVMHGVFDNPTDWPPSNPNSVYLTSWEMRLEGKKNKNIACTSDLQEGVWSANPPELIIEVIPINN